MTLSINSTDKIFAIRNSFFIDKIFLNLLGFTSNNFDYCCSASLAVNTLDATAQRCVLPVSFKVDLLLWQ